mmetsp:Transcript_8039/g.10042  ORF Transcript_8039/g.10042 Transcript_8039/m.10042 type:complete len:297 (+) Transcript_8039:183-1073(+)|eukprot:CAMPEP_0203709020 /NCGR_PEP_ID=MMETSP0091-20130426/60774_1 /ASSEMBLY_ACC=CAM_ASM_001089 /TAXON_ID=426623 /ORGANISM="Chaetoceros affinis, Strain CCMP159" /LENGTH=296 /DNA_ID=CAMNT_0050585901 /DNA_START=61 /DNA_END=951 /DNA_ORIENTATION=+
MASGQAFRNPPDKPHLVRIFKVGSGFPKKEEVSLVEALKLIPDLCHPLRDGDDFGASLSAGRGFRLHSLYNIVEKGGREATTAIIHEEIRVPNLVDFKTAAPSLTEVCDYLIAKLEADPNHPKKENKEVSNKNDLVWCHLVNGFTPDVLPLPTATRYGRIKPGSKGQTGLFISFDDHDAFSKLPPPAAGMVNGMPSIYLNCTMDGSDMPSGPHGTMHLNLLEVLLEKEVKANLNGKKKIDWAVGYAIGQKNGKLVLKYNSCSNLRADGTRALSKEHYEQLFRILASSKQYSGLMRE